MLRRLSIAAATLFGLCAVSGGVFARAPQGPSPTLDDVLSTTRRYVLDYEKKLTLIVADETSLQRVYWPDVSAPTYPTRLMKSEIFFAFTPSMKEWLAVRDVKVVDGTPVQRGPDVGLLLATLPADQVSAELKAYNSRFNIGSSYRNYNEPTLSLLLFDTNWPEDLVFELKRVEHANGVALATVAFHERGAPTLIVHLDRSPAPSSGEATVEIATGRPRRIVVKTPIGNVLSELETTYGHDTKLDAWLPMTFVEHYTSHLATGDEAVVCRATYSNFRRFEVHGGIK